MNLKSEMEECCIEQRDAGQPSLSICIPTYNRAHTLGRLLEGIALQLTDVGVSDMVEIVIADNASDDNTGAVVQSFIDRGISIRYAKQESNLGFGRNLSHAIAIASGEYCWMMGSDDVLCPGSLAAVLAAIVARPHLMLGDAVTFGKTRSFLTGQAGTMQIVDADGVAAFLQRCNEVSSLFAFMSTIVVRRDFWHAVNETPELLGHPYTHLLRIFEAISRQPTVFAYLGVPLVDTGAEGNEWDVNMANHFRLDCATMGAIATRIFPGQARVDHALGVVFQRQYAARQLLRARAGMQAAHWDGLSPVLKRWGYPQSAIARRPYDGAIYLAYRAVKMVKGWLQ